VVLKCRNKITNYARNIPATGSPPDWQVYLVVRFAPDLL
jgi:hypothetical protein